MMKSPFLDEALLSAEAQLDVEPSLERLTQESPFFQGFAEDLLNPEASEEEYQADEFPPDDEQEFMEGYGAEPDEESSDVEHDLPTGASPLDALSPSELKAVRITSTFETGRAGSFGGLTGNFDGQGVSFGLMNFAWKAGSLITLLKEFINNHPAAFDEVFGPDAGRFREMVLATRPNPKNPKRRERDLERQMEFARDVLNDANNKVREPWRGYFGRLEVNPHFRRIQVGAVRRAAERARYWCQYFGLKTERGFAFMFDLVSSHGGAWLNAAKFKGKRRKLLRAMLEKKKAEVGRAELTELEKLEVIANMIADVSGKEWRQKVRVRKLWFVRGRGEVHKTPWDLAKDFGVTDAPPDFGGAAGSKELSQELETHAPDENDEAESWERFSDASETEEEGDLATVGTAEYFGGPDEEEWLDEEHEEPEDFFAGEEESPYAEEGSDLDHRSEMLVCSPSASEMQQADLDELESDADRANEEGEGPGIESEYAVELHIHKAGAGRAPAELALGVQQWGTAQTSKVGGVRLKVYECDLGEAGRSDTSTARNVQMAEFTLDLTPNPAFAKNPGKPGVSPVIVTNAKWANAPLEKSYKATRNADFILKLGNRDFPLWLPREDILEEGTAAELGFVLEDGAGNKVERTSITQGHTISVSMPDHLKSLLDIPGRFDDPQRDAAVEMDGTKFDEFLNSRNRREFITKWLDEHPALKDAASEPNADLKTGDIIKAWFVVHDVGAGATLTDKRFKANQPATKSGAVHGFLNRAGYYAATHDFTKNRQGTVYEFLSKKGRELTGGRTINIETVPDIEKGVADNPDGSHGQPSNAGLYASIGYKRIYTKVKGKTVYSKKVDYYKWTKTALDVLADLYIFASARARHLLTITAHKELDRNLARSVIWREYTAAEVRAGKGKHWDTVRDTPSNYHGDPHCFNMQALYDLITQKLNALGGKQMPAGARYGVHPRRLCKADGEDVGNGDGQLHEFPHQSDPNVKRDTGIKKNGWWNP